jgi:hypothetical protein
MTKNVQEPLRRPPTYPKFVPYLDRCDWSYERLAECRQVITKVKDSSFLWPHEKGHLEEIIARIDSTVSLKHQREEYWAKKNANAQAE